MDEIKLNTDQDQSMEKDVSNRMPFSVIWVGIMVTYLLLFSLSGYIAFFQEPYNPASNPSDRAVEMLKNDATREHFMSALKQESEAFKARRDLASQSFNVVLGALLGFLSASATQGLMRRKDH
jgi:hypothetical protein